MTVARTHRLPVPCALRNAYVAMACALMPMSRCNAFPLFPPLLQEFTP